MIDWLFRDRTTGRITLFQVPNVPLALFLAVSILRRLAHPGGTVGTVTKVVATVALVAWAVDEVARGVNPFRRILGGAVLAVTVVALVR